MTTTLWSVVADAWPGLAAVGIGLVSILVNVWNIVDDRADRRAQQEGDHVWRE